MESFSALLDVSLLDAEPLDAELLELSLLLQALANSENAAIKTVSRTLNRFRKL